MSALMGDLQPFANPHGFDYGVWLLEQGVSATGYARPAPRCVRALCAACRGKNMRA